MNVMQIVVDINLSFVVSSQVPMRQKHTQKHTWVRGPVGFWRGTLKFMQDIKILTCLSTRSTYGVVQQALLAEAFTYFAATRLQDWFCSIVSLTGLLLINC